VDVRDAQVWQLVDERVDGLRCLPFDELRRRASAKPEVEALDGGDGRFRRRSRVVLLSEDRVGIKVSVDGDGRRPRAERGIIVTPEGRLAPEWSFGDEPPRANPFVFGLRTTPAGVAIAVVLLIVFVALASGAVR
jgi:hypothetical protein